MHIWNLVVFATAICIATATPGPTIVTLVARVLATGRSDNFGFAIGIIAGDVLWLGAAVFGLAALADLELALEDPPPNVIGDLLGAAGAKQPVRQCLGLFDS